MNSIHHKKILNLIKYKDNPAALNAAGVLLIFNEAFEDAYGIFSYNYEVNEDEMAKKYLEEFWFVTEYIKDFNKALDLSINRDYRQAKKILDFYYNKGFITISGIKLLMICLFKCKRYREFKELNEKLKDLGCDIEFDKYIQYLNVKRRSILYVMATLPIIISAYVGRLSKEAEVVYKSVSPKEKVVYRYIKDNSSEKLKQLLGTDLEKVLYKNGLNKLRKTQYAEAYDYFKLAYEFASNSYIKQHTVFMLATASKNLNKQEAEIYYKEYIRSFKGGCYYNEALYNLVLLLNEKGQAEAREYAKMIDKKSIFFNSKIKRIIEGGI